MKSIFILLLVFFIIKIIRSIDFSNLLKKNKKNKKYIDAEFEEVE